MVGLGFNSKRVGLALDIQRLPERIWTDGIGPLRQGGVVMDV